jgi:hypothetical protein
MLHHSVCKAVRDIDLAEQGSTRTFKNTHPHLRVWRIELTSRLLQMHEKLAEREFGSHGPATA